MRSMMQQDYVISVEVRTDSWSEAGIGLICSNWNYVRYINKKKTSRNGTQHKYIVGKLSHVVQETVKFKKQYKINVYYAIIT